MLDVNVRGVLHASRSPARCAIRRRALVNIASVGAYEDFLAQSLRTIRLPPHSPQ